MSDFLKLLYLDRAFVSALYEFETGENPETKITSSDTLQASAKIPLFSGGASSTETRTYSLYSIGMYSCLEKRLSKFPAFDDLNHQFKQSSKYVWITGMLTIHNVIRSHDVQDEKTGKPRKEIISETPYMAIATDDSNFALIPTDDYFTSGLAALKELHNSVVGPIELPIKALVRVLSAQTDFKQWVSIPLVVLEP